MQSASSERGNESRRRERIRGARDGAASEARRSARLGSPTSSFADESASECEGEARESEGAKYLLRLLRIDDVLFVASGVAFAI